MHDFTDYIPQIMPYTVNIGLFSGQNICKTIHKLDFAAVFGPEILRCPMPGFAAEPTDHIGDSGIANDSTHPPFWKFR